jgi:threonine dehydrogenase-like Zn-dependent dehydrogenase
VIDAVGRASAVTPFLPLLARDAVFANYGLDDTAQYSLDVLAAPSPFSVRGQDGYSEHEAHEPVLRNWQAGLLDAQDFLGDLEHPYALEDINEALAAVRDRRALKTLVKLKG